MGQSNRLRLSDVRGVMRLLGDARDLRYDGPAQRWMLVNGLTRLIGGHNAFSVLFENFLPGRHPVPAEMISWKRPSPSVSVGPSGSPCTPTRARASGASSSPVVTRPVTMIGPVCVVAGLSRT